MTHRWAGPLLGLLLCLAAAAPAAAQDGKTASREREALRRSQAALQQAQQQRDALQAEKEAWQRTQQGQAALRKAEQDRLLAAQAEAGRLKAAQRLLQDESGRQRQALVDAEAQAESRRAALLQAHQAELAALRTERDERTQANRALTARLEASTSALDAAHERNRQLYGVAREAVERYRSKSVADQAMQGDPFFGLTAVRIESTAEDLLIRLDALRTPP
jgi:hypothetical protein